MVFSLKSKFGAVMVVLPSDSIVSSNTLPTSFSFPSITLLLLNNRKIIPRIYCLFVFMAKTMTSKSFIDRRQARLRVQTRVQEVLRS